MEKREADNLIRAMEQTAREFKKIGNVLETFNKNFVEFAKRFPEQLPDGQVIELVPPKEE